MTRLWDEEMRTGSRALRLETLNSLGGGERIVRMQLDQVMKKLRRRNRRFAASLFHFLVTPTGTNIAHTPQDLAFYAERPPDKVQPALTLLSSPGVVIFASFLLIAVAFYMVYEERQQQDRMVEALKQQDRAVPSFKAVMRRHADWVNSAVFGPDGQFIVTAGDQTARVWNARAGEEVATLRGHDNVVWNATFSPDGQPVVTASMDDTVRVWKVDMERVLAELGGHGSSVTRAPFTSR